MAVNPHYPPKCHTRWGRAERGGEKPPKPTKNHQNSVGDGCTPRGTPRNGQGRAPPGKCWRFSNFCCLRCPGRPARPACALLRSAPSRRCRWSRRGLGRPGPSCLPAGRSVGRELRLCGVGRARGRHAWVSRAARAGPFAAAGQWWNCKFWSSSRDASPLGPPRVSAPARSGSRRAGGPRSGGVFALLPLPPGTGGMSGSPQAFRRRPLEFSDTSWKLLASGCPRWRRWRVAQRPGRRLGAEGRARPSSPADPEGSPLGSGWLPAPRRGK